MLEIIHGAHGGPLYGNLSLNQDHFLDPSDLASLARYARDHGFISKEETLRSVSKAGEGNMNLTLRLTTDSRSLILKQARPWVEKYPEIPAPDARALVETAFYTAAMTRTPLRDAMPKLLGSDPEARVVVLEDLGERGDFTSLYAGGVLSATDLEALLSFLVVLHVPWARLPPIFANRDMRALNHEHIFQLPLAAANGLDLDAITPGLQDAAAALAGDSAYVARTKELGELYLSDGETLVHGDYFPGSWLETADGVRVIDPEFCFLGPAAFDVGVLLGHLYLADQPEALIGDVLSRYGASVSTAKLSREFAGVEIMRRLIGVAQLPLGHGIDKKRELLALSRKLVLGE